MAENNIISEIITLKLNQNTYPLILIEGTISIVNHPLTSLKIINKKKELKIQGQIIECWDNDAPTMHQADHSTTHCVGESIEVQTDYSKEPEQKIKKLKKKFNHESLTANAVSFLNLISHEIKNYNCIIERNDNQEIKKLIFNAETKNSYILYDNDASEVLKYIQATPNTNTNCVDPKNKNSEPPIIPISKEKGV